MSDYDKVIRVVEKGRQAELAAEFFKSFLADKVEEVSRKIDVLVQTKASDPNLFMAQCYVFTELRTQIKHLEQAIMRSRVAEAKQHGG
jgi:hypothetical protein